MTQNQIQYCVRISHNCIRCNMLSCLNFVLTIQTIDCLPNKMNNNESLQRDVQNALKWEPLLHAAEIGVTVKDGIVNLTGTVDSFNKKQEAENATKNVKGVKAIVEKIEVKFTSSIAKSDNDLVNDILKAMKMDFEVPIDKVKVMVEDGWVTLDGELPWNYQREAAKRSIKKVHGLKGITTNITIKSESLDQIEQQNIESALNRNWSVNDQDIRVIVSGSVVTLKGTVNSWYQKEEAEKIAWNAPGVSYVINDLVIEYAYALID